MVQPNRRQVSLRMDAWYKAAQLRDSLVEKTGRKVTITDTIERALECLEDAHRRGAWLSPKEAAPVMEQRMRNKIVSVLAQFVARAMPDRRLVKIVVYPPGDALDVVLEAKDRGEETFPLLVSATEAYTN